MQNQSFLPQEIIRKKRDGKTLINSEIEFMISNYVTGQVTDYHMSALAMAIYFQGCNDNETASLLNAMINTGKRFDWSKYKKQRIFVDKHSTGGVGDKTSLIILPLLIADGLDVPMVAGRGLGHTGGTLDKLESLPGLKTQISMETFESLIDSQHGAFGAQTAEFVPADKKLYALRDVTSTVESQALIISSIMSKKLAESLDALVLDIKFGSGAFIPEYEKALNFAQSLVNVGKAAGCKVTAALTNMDEPLGRSAGNALEVAECLDVMSGAGPLDTRELSLQLAARVAALAHNQNTAEGNNKAYYRMKDHLDSGRAMDIFVKLCVAQGANIKDLTRQNTDWLNANVQVSPVNAQTSGWITHIDTRELGLIILLLGGGRRQTADLINYQVGLSQIKKKGDYVNKGEPICFVHHTNTTDLESTIKSIRNSVVLGAQQPAPIPLIKTWVE